MTLSQNVRKLFEGKNFAHIATLMADGSPQVTPVWVELQGDQIVFNTDARRIKFRNIRRDPRVAISIIDQQNPYQQASVRGRVVEWQPDKTGAHIDKLARKYMDVDIYPYHEPGEQRVIVEVIPEKVGTV